MVAILEPFGIFLEKDFGPPPFKSVQISDTTVARTV